MGANRMVCVVEVGLKREDNQALGREFGCFSVGIRGLIGRRRKVARVEGTPNGGYGSLGFNRFFVPALTEGGAALFALGQADLCVCQARPCVVAEFFAHAVMGIPRRESPPSAFGSDSAPFPCAD